MSLAWHTAVLTRAAFAASRKRPMIKHDKLQLKSFQSAAAKRAAQTPEQMLGVVKMLNAAYGGNVIDNRSKTEH